MKLEFLKFWKKKERVPSYSYEGTLREAGRNGDLTVLKSLIDDARDDIKSSALRIASKYGRLNIIQYTVENGYVDLNECGNIAIIACEYGHIDIVRYLVENKYSNLQKNLLLVASKFGHLDIVKYVLPEEIFDCYAARTSIRYAIENNNLKIVKYISDIFKLEQDYDEIFWKSAIESAIKRLRRPNDDNFEIIKYLLEEKKAYIDIDDNYALRKASEYGHIELVKYLLKHNAIRYEKRDTNGFMSLYVASEFGHLEVVKCLVEKGGINKLERSHALAGARKYKRENVIAYLTSINKE